MLPSLEDPALTTLGASLEPWRLGAASPLRRLAVSGATLGWALSFGYSSSVWVRAEGLEFQASGWALGLELTVQGDEFRG